LLRARGRNEKGQKGSGRKEVVGKRKLVRKKERNKGISRHYLSRGERSLRKLSPGPTEKKEDSGEKTRTGQRGAEMLKGVRRKGRKAMLSVRLKEVSRKVSEASLYEAEKDEKKLRE